MGRPNGQPGKPIGRTALRRIRATLVRAIDNDVRLGYVQRNVAGLPVMPAELTKRPERRALTHDELTKLCEAATGAVGVLIDLVGRNGLRPAEARAMRWEKIDYENAVMKIDCQLNNQDEFTNAKTKKAFRSINLDETTIKRLKNWRKEQERQVEKARKLWQDLDLVATTASGRAIQRNNFGRSLRKLCEQCSINPAIAPYELRHTAISLQADAGHPAFLIADWAGTSERMISDVSDTA